MKTTDVYVFEKGGIPTDSVLHREEVPHQITGLSIGKLLDRLRNASGVRVRFGRRRTWMPISEQDVQQKGNHSDSVPDNALPYSGPQHWLIIDAPRGGYWKIAHGWEEEATGRFFEYTRLQQGTDHAKRVDEAVFPLIIHAKDANNAGLGGLSNASDLQKISESAVSRDAAARQDRQRVWKQEWERSAEHRRAVLCVYGTACAICGWEATSSDGLFGVDAAHIRPISAGGQDGPENGLPLCPNHHWLFDEGVITIDEDFRVIVTDTGLVEGEAMDQLDGTPLQLPPEGPRPSQGNVNWRTDPDDKL